VDLSLGQVARGFDPTETAVREWVKQAERESGQRTDVLTTADRQEFTVLRRENRRLQQDVETLRRATVNSTGRRNSWGLTTVRATDGGQRRVRRRALAQHHLAEAYDRAEEI